MKTKKIGINGFGRIGRLVFRAWLERQTPDRTLFEGDLEIVAVNNPLRKGETIGHYVHMLQYDSVHGKLKGNFEVLADGFTYNGSVKVKFYTELDPANIPWEKEEVDLVVDSTGIFKDKAGLGKHLRGTVKKVMMSAPGEGLDATFVVGVNDHTYDTSLHHIVSNASCTTNCLAPIVKVLDEKYGIINGLVSTTHSYTGDQNLVDGSHSDLRRARAAACSMILSKTGAAKAIGEVIPHLKGKLDGSSIRVPTPDVSILDATFNLKNKTTKEELIKVFKEAASGSLKGILDVSDLPLVSIDYVGNPHSSIIDSEYLMVMDGSMVKIMAFYDNEWGYSNRVLDLATKML